MRSFGRQKRNVSCIVNCQFIGDHISHNFESWDGYKNTAQVWVKPARCLVKVKG